MRRKILAPGPQPRGGGNGPNTKAVKRWPFPNGEPKTNGIVRDFMGEIGRALNVPLRS